MKLAVLFSGGKDSTYALHLAKKYETVICLISIVSKNPDSYMFHTPNIEWVKLQAKKLGLPIIIKETLGNKEEELEELKQAINEAKQKYGVKGIVSGAVESVYQATRLQKISDELKIECFNPLWQKNQLELLNEIVDLGFEVIIGSVAAHPFDESWLGKKIDKKTIKELELLKEKIKINPAGEGGEYESFVLNSPDFSEKINIKKAKKTFQKNSGIYLIEEAQ